MKSLYIGFDFDNTVVTQRSPELGEEIEEALEVLEELQEAGHKLILVTMRSGERLVQAVEYLEDNGIKPYAVNENPSQKYWTESPKIFCNLYIDDLALGCPLDIDTFSKPVVDWYEVRNQLKERELL